MPNNRPHFSRVPFDRRTVIAATAGAFGLGAVGALGVRRATAQTPIPTGGTFPDRFGDLLAIAPMLDLNAASGFPLYYADILTQMEATGVDLPGATAPVETLPVGYAQASLALPLAAQAFAHGLTPEWFETFGFSSLSVHRTISLDEYPRTIAIFQGGIDPATVEAALDASGYRQVDQETGGAYWTVGDELSVDSAVGRLGVGAMNSAALFGDTVAFTFLEATIQTVTQTAAGLAPSMLEQGVWTSMASLFPDDTVGLIPTGPALLDRLLPNAATATPATAASSGEIEYLAFGVRAGSISEPLSLVGEGTPEPDIAVGAEAIPARVELRIRYVAPDIAEREVAALPDRWEDLNSLMTGQPYGELMTVEAARVHADDHHVGAFVFTSPTPNRWIQMIQTLDLLPLVPTVG